MTFSLRPDVAPRPLAGAAALLQVRSPDAGSARRRVLLSGVAHDSNAVRPGDLFAALPGTTTHGARFIGAAAAAGAVAVLTDVVGSAAAEAAGLPALVVNRPRHQLGPVAAYVYGNPSDDLLIVGITGTNGKTTTAWLVDAALRANGKLTGLIGTIAIKVGDEALPSTRTTPEATDLQALLAVMKQRGVTAVTMEVSSHALAMGRVNAVGFDIAGFTNLTQDHLDFHVDMEDYFATKSMLFTDAYARRGVVMVDDAFGQRLAGHAGVPVHTASAASSHADWWVEGRSSQPDGLQRFSVRGPGRTRLGLVSSLPGRFNVANSLLAAALVLETGASAKKVAAGLSELSEVPGRMERIALGQQFLVLVDYAHTPHAVESLMQAVRPDTSGRVLLVIGAGGDRDRAKRSLMGEIAAAGADVLIVTDDNPRSEDPATIRAAVLVGASGIAASDRAEIIEIADRAEAISEAIRMARPGDAVIVAGKGHESGQDLGDVTVPFHDRAVVEDALRSVLS